MPSALRRVRGWWWDHSLLWRRPARRWKRELSLLVYRWRRWRGSEEGPRVVVSEPPQKPSPSAGRPQPSPGGRGRHPPSLSTLTGKDFWLVAHPEADDLPPTLVESLMMAAVAEDLSWCAAGWAAPAPGSFGPSGELFGGRAMLLRMPSRKSSSCEVVGRLVGHVTAIDDNAPTWSCWPWTRSGPYLLTPECGVIFRHRAHDVDAALQEPATVPGPPTALFLVPFLAIGGAENLLFDLLAGLTDQYRVLVVTTEPHLEHLGQTVDRCRELTPYVYTLGDWLPREAIAGAVRHLLRRYEVESLVCWNGTTLFYDELTNWRRDLPDLRILNQLYNHEGGWIEHLGPRSIAAIDVHLAVNGLIVQALEQAHGVAPDQVALVHHGVDIPALPSETERRERRRRARERFDIPRDAVVVGTFVRLHPQKRPLDVLALARRVADSHPEIHFLLAGGGPLDAEIDRELELRPLANLTRLPLQSDVELLFDATDLCLSTSSFEGLPVFLLESLARQIPCIATAVGDIPDLLADGGGILVEIPGDLDALESGLVALLDPERREREGRTGRRTVEARFGLGPYRQRYERLIFSERPPRSWPPSTAVPPSGQRRAAAPLSRAGVKREGERDRARGNPQVSVVVPSYNHGRFLKACLESVLDSDADLELVVVDDGSTDNSREVLQTFAKDPRVHAVEQENQGAHAALNRGVELARGDLIFILNSDDLFEPQRIPLFVERFEREPELTALCSWLRVIDDQGAELGIKQAWRNMPPWPKPSSRPGLEELGDPTLALLATNYVATTSNVAFRRQLFTENGVRFAPLRYTHDWDFLLTAALHGRLEVIEEPLVRYRVHQSNTIAEGRADATGAMHFEILWTVARHAQQICRRSAAKGLNAEDLRHRVWASLPRFDRDELLAQLLLLRGEEPESPEFYDALLEPDHHFRQRAIEVLG